MAPHQCVHCSKLYPDASKELLEGCSCGSKFFYYIKKEFMEQLENKKIEIDNDIQEKISQLDRADKKQIEADVRQMMGIEEKEEVPVILDLESIRVLKPGKYEIDVVNLFNKKRPLIYKLEEGKYIIDLASTIKVNADELDKKIRDPEKG